MGSECSTIVFFYFNERCNSDAECTLCKKPCQCSCCRRPNETNWMQCMWWKTCWSGIVKLWIESYFGMRHGKWHMAHEGTSSLFYRVHIKCIKILHSRNTIFEMSSIQNRGEEIKMPLHSLLFVVDILPHSRIEHWKKNLFADCEKHVFCHGPISFLNATISLKY